ncbi:MAG: ATP-binding protein [Bacteroides sp.]|nr:ATP-binding protein [Ruminococcus flavefaciens]MCM1554524.1 ATP-binding protein [Bacteroides sp.]
MSDYVYTLRNYHAVKDASIKLDGITVLTGINGAGKSTLSKWLYYSVNGANSYDRYIYVRFAAALRDRVKVLDRIRWELEFATTEERRGNARFFRDALNQMAFLGSDDADLGALIEVFQKVSEHLGEELEIYLNTRNIPRVRRDRVFSVLGIESDITEDVSATMRIYREKQQHLVEVFQKRYLMDKEKRGKETFFELVHNKFNMRDEYPQDIQFEEDGVKLFDEGKVGHLYNLTQAIYIDTPMALFGETGMDNVFWQDLNEFVLDSRENYEAPLEAKKILKRLSSLLHGKAILADDDFGQKEVHFRREDGLEIKVQDAATGVKSFSYIQRLLENGYLGDKTLLMIDEPEAHLHPQWIIEFARILVLLHKNLGVKVLVASHNPHMVEALQTIANKENVLEDLHCYLAESIDDYMFTYVDQGHDIERIFKSFNMAYNKMDEYGIGV